MYDNLVRPALPLLTAMAVLVVGVGCIWRIVQRLFAGLQQTCDPDAESTTLHPAAVGEGRVIWSRSGEVPI
jgi:hypothetical protein